MTGRGSAGFCRCLALLAGVSLWACGGDAGPSGTPTRLFFQDAGGTGNEIPDSALVVPGTVILVRAT